MITDAAATVVAAVCPTSTDCDIQIYFVCSYIAMGQELFSEELVQYHMILRETVI